MGKVKTGENDIKTKRPDIAKLMENYNKKNPKQKETNNPSKISVSGNSEVYCICDKGHTFHRIANKISKLQRDEDNNIICPVCSGKETQKGINSLGDLRPDMMKDWYWEKNNELNIDPYTISPRSSKKVWWKCKHNHYWQASPSSRINKEDETKIYGCKYCGKQAMWPGETDALTVLKSLNREDIIEQFLAADNNNLKLSEIFFHDTKPYNFKCSICGTISKKPFTQAVKYGCKGCANQVVTPLNNLKFRYPDVAAKFDKSGVNKITSDKIIMGGNNKYGFYCDICKKVYYDTISHQIKGRGCTECHKTLTSSYPEQVLYEYIKNCLTGIEVKNAEKIKKSIFDIYIKDFSTVIEYDGEYAHNGEKAKKRENKFNNTVKEEKLTLFRIKEIRKKNLPKNRKYYKLYKNKDFYLVYIPVPSKSNKILKEICIATINAFNTVHNTNYSFDFDKLDLSIAELNSLKLTKNNLLNKYPKFVEKYWDYEKNNKLGITPDKVCPKTHTKVYLFNEDKTESKLKRLDNTMRYYKEEE